MADSAVNLNNPEGELVNVPAEQANAALSNGYTKASDEDVDAYNEKQLYGSMPTGAAAVGAIHSALPFGIGAKILEKMGLSGSDQEKLAKYNPVSSTSGEIAGIFTPGVGLGAVATKLGKATADLTKLATLGESAGVAGKVASVLARGATEGAIFGINNAYNDAVTGDPDEVAQHLLSEVGTSALWGAGIGGGLGLLGNVAPRGILAAKKGIAGVSDALGVSNAIKAVSNAGKEGFASLSSVASGVPKEEILAKIANMGKEAAPLKAEEVAGHLQDLHEGVESALKDAANNYEELTPQTQQAINDYMQYTDSTRNTGTYAKQFMYKSPQGLKVDSGKVETFLKNSNTAKGAKAADALSGYITSSSNLVDNLEHEYSLGAANPNPDLDNIRELVAKNKDVIQQQEDSALANRFQQQQGRGGLGEAAGIGYVGHALGIPSPVTGAIAGAFEALRDPIEAINKIAKVQKTLSNSVDRISRLAAAVASSSDTGAAVKGYVAGQAAIPDKAKYEKVTSQIQALNSDMEGTSNKLNNNTAILEPHAPGIVQSMNSVAGRALSFLSSKILFSQDSGPLAKPPVPSPAQISAFSKYYQVVEHPLTILKDALAGKLTHEGIEAISAVHPQLYNRIKAEVMQRLTPKQVNLPYKRKMMLSLLLGTNVEGSMLPQAIQSNQALVSLSGAQNDAKDAALQGKPKVRKPGLDKLTVSERALTAQQASAQRTGKA